MTALFISLSSFAHTSYEKEIKCPLDGKKFIIRVTGSYTTFKTLKDFQKQGAIGDLYESAVNACPQCHFSGYQGDFDTTYTGQTKEDLLKIIEPFKDAKMTDVLENEIAVKIHQYFKSDNDEIAYLYLVASYFLRFDSAQTVKRKELQRKAAEHFIIAVNDKEYSKKEKYASINYLIGEMYRRTDDFDNAIKYYDLALNDKDKADWLEEIVKEQKGLALKRDGNNRI